jgi:hypothetical protein
MNNPDWKKNQKARARSRARDKARKNQGSSFRQTVS